MRIINKRCRARRKIVQKGIVKIVYFKSGFTETFEPDINVKNGQEIRIQTVYKDGKVRSGTYRVYEISKPPQRVEIVK